KCGVNTAAIARPEVMSEIARRFGNQVLVLSIDARRVTDDTPEGTARSGSGFEVTTHGGRRGTGIDAIAWIREVTERGAGEILLNSMDADGTEQGFDLELIRLARGATTLPLIASGGAGLPEHFAPAVHAGADAVLAASVFHFQQMTIAEAKAAMAADGITVRCALRGRGSARDAVRHPEGVGAAGLEPHEAGLGERGLDAHEIGPGGIGGVRQVRDPGVPGVPHHGLRGAACGGDDAAPGLLVPQLDLCGGGD